jgi:hypothetical protein
LLHRPEPAAAPLKVQCQESLSIPKANFPSVKSVFISVHPWLIFMEVQSPEAGSARTATLPREVWAVLVGGASIAIGILWDISWHRTIGRDTFWTPAHMAIYFGGILGGLTCGWLVLRTTFFAPDIEKKSAVRVWGFRGPLGAWLTIWGALAMVISAPFDNWWHEAYGVDVKILSPPHSVLAMGMWATVLGALFLLLREQNLAPADRPSPGRNLYIVASGILLVMAGIFLIEYSFPNQHRTVRFYVASSVVFPFYLLGLSRASKFRWGATWIALIYMAIMAGMGWVLPLFPGQPKLGPIYNPIHHFVSLPFPLLLVVPALGIDLSRRWIGQGRGWKRDWLLVITAGCAFVLLFLVTQWFFSAFLLSPAAQNWFFAADRHWGYRESHGDWRGKYWSETYPAWNPPLRLKGFLIALAVSLASARVGLWAGNWMARVKR